MSIEFPGHAASPRLLPAAVESSVRDWALRSLGCVLVGFAVLAWISMLSWTVADPSLTHATARPVKNLLGPLGAAGSDLMIQTLGASVVFVVIGPMIWGLELLAGCRSIPRFGIKLLAFPIAVLAIAGALSGLPTLSIWPLHNGFGGMMGDIIYNMSTMAVTGVSPEHGSSMAGTGLGGVGFCLLLNSLGFRLDHLGAVAAMLLPRSMAPGGMRSSSRPVQGAAAASADRQAVGAAAALDTSDDRTPPTLQMPRPVEPSPSVDAEASTGAADPDQDAVEARAFAERFAHKVETKPATKVVKKVQRPADAIAMMSVPPAKKPKRPTRPAIADAPRPVVDPAMTERARGPWLRPSFDLLGQSAAVRHGHPLHLVDADAKAGLLVDVLADFGVSGAICDIKPGPVVTRYEFEPARGVKTSRVIGLADDIARSLGASAVRIAVVPGRNAIGVEVPNSGRQPVLLRDVLESEAFASSTAALPLALGRGIGGEPIVADLARMPHLLIAGTTGSGKSVGINAMILSLIYRLDPSQCRLLLIDPKMLELAAYNAIPHLLGPVVTDPQAAAAALEWAVGEMERRYQRMAKLGVRNIEAFNARAKRSLDDGQSLVRTVQTGFDQATGQPLYEHEPIDAEPMPYIVVVVDEFADLMLTAGHQVEAAIQRLAQMARAAGIHLIMATQRPSVDVVTGTIKANFPMRISFRVASRTDSRTILGESGAEQLLGQGDMLVSSGAGQPHRVHGAFVSDDEIARVVASFGGPSAPAAGAAQPRPGAVQGACARPLPVLARITPQDQVYDDAVSIVIADRKVSPGHLHRRLGITEAMAAELILRMEHEQLVGALDRFGRRKILVATPWPGRQAVA